jgi:hypothetical protein
VAAITKPLLGVVDIDLALLNTAGFFVYTFRLVPLPSSCMFYSYMYYNDCSAHSYSPVHVYTIASAVFAMSWDDWLQVMRI